MEGYLVSNGSKNVGSTNKSTVIITRKQKTAKRVTAKNKGPRGGCCFKRIK